VGRSHHRPHHRPDDGPLPGPGPRAPEPAVRAAVPAHHRGNARRQQRRRVLRPPVLGHQGHPDLRQLLPGRLRRLEARRRPGGRPGLADRLPGRPREVHLHPAHLPGDQRPCEQRPCVHDRGHGPPLHLPGPQARRRRARLRARPVVYPEIQRDLCPGLFSETVPPGADADIFAWRQLAWDNAQRLMAAPTDKARDAIARDIRRHAKDKAREILHWYQ
jgi:hypothetical protein